MVRVRKDCFRNDRLHLLTQGKANTMNSISRREFLTRAAVLGAGVSAPTLLRAQTTSIRWGESLAANHPQVLMAERIAKEVKEKTGGRIDIQVFPNSQLGSGKEM